MSLRTSLAAAVTRVTHPQPVADLIESGAGGGGVPDPFLHLLTRPWRAQPDDTAGGWCVTLDEDPRTPGTGALAIAAFLSRDLATHIAEIHNRSIGAESGTPSRR